MTRKEKKPENKSSIKIPKAEINSKNSDQNNSIANKNPDKILNKMNSEFILNTISASAGFGISLINKNYDIEWYNGILTKWYGKLENKKVRKCFEIFEHRDTICQDCPTKTVFETGKAAESLRIGIKTSEGDNRVIMITSSPIFDSKGNVINVLEIAKDITKQKQEEEELKVSEERFRAIFEQAAIGIALLNTKTGQIININQKYCDLLGYTKQEMLQKTFMDITFVEDTQTNIDKNAELIEGTIKEFTYEKRYVRKDGKIVWGELTISPLWKPGEKPQTYLHIAMVIDINERKMAEEIIRKSEENYRNLFDNSEVGMFRTRLDGSEVLEFNKKYLSILGYTLEDVKGMSSKNLWADKSERDSMVQMLKAEGQVTDFECGILNKQGEVKRCITSLRLFNDTGILEGSIIDITDRKKAEEEIKLQNQQLQKINSEKDKYFSIIAHDLRSPFTGFLGFTELLKTSISDMSIKELQLIANNMNISAKNLFDLLTNLLEWSMMQRGLTTFEPEKFSVKYSVKNIVDVFNDMANNKTIEIEFEISEDIYVRADKAMFENIVRNLISNAIKFTNKGGRVKISAKESDEKIIVSVKDTGIGMSNELINDLFKIDKNTSRKGTENERSTGLGLLLCKEFVEIHNGNITVESEEGQGSEFTVSFPIIVS